jgi:putative DNA primase/helicase
MNYSDVVDQMSDCGINGVSESDLVADGKIHRFKSGGDKKKNGWYVLFEFAADSGELLIAGAFGDWKLGVSEHVAVRSERISDAERERFRREQERAKKAAEAERARVAGQAAERAETIWRGLPDEGRSPYLDRKRVRAFGLRFSRGSIVVPVRDVMGKLWGLQFIAPDGSKKFLTGTAKKGRLHLLGEPAPGQFLAIAEGYATAASVHAACGCAVAVAFDAGNLKPAAMALHTRYPESDIIICGDDDIGTDGNPGRAAAESAAAAVGGTALFPKLPTAA